MSRRSFATTLAEFFGFAAVMLLLLVCLVLA